MTATTILPEAKRPDRLEQISRVITFITFTIAMFSLLAAPLLALQWRQNPFPGLLLDPHLVVNSRAQPDWPGRQAGIDEPARIIRVAGVPVFDISDFQSALANQETDNLIPVFTRLPDGTVNLYPKVQLIKFKGSDFITFFWLPYLVGLAYFGMALWIFGASGQTRPGRALAFFCVAVSLAAGLLFEILTTHWTDGVWICAVSALGGTLISLSLRFPVEWQPVRTRPWILAVPYLISIGLGLWGIVALRQPDQPWNYLQARSASYRYTALGVLLFFIIMYLRARYSARAGVRRQARLVLFGSLVAFIPILSWLLAPIFGIGFKFNTVLLLPGLLLFPVTVATAIFHYRLLEIDSLLNRAIVYGILTATLAGVIAATVALLQRFFITVTGERSDLAVIITTLIVVSATTPIKNLIQAWVDRQYRELPTSQLKVFGKEVQTHIRMTDPDLLGSHFIERAAENLRAESAAFLLDEKGELVVRHTYGNWRGAAMVSVPIYHSGKRVGILQLGPRRAGKKYQQYEVESLADVSQQVGRILANNMGFKEPDIGG